MPGSIGWTYIPGTGVWRSGKPVLTWCPTVTRHLAHYSTRGHIAARRVTIAVGDTEVTVPITDVVDGSVWTRFPVAGVGEKTVRDVLRNIVDAQAAALPLGTTTPRWEAGRLELPPADVLPAGYLAVAGEAQEWRELLRQVARSPRMALVVGLAVGGLYVRPLGRQSYTVHLPGGSSEGKTSTLRAAAAVFGDPRNSVIKPWASTQQGIPTLHRAVGTLTTFRDELGSSEYRGDRLGKMILFLMEGCERDRSDRSGGGLVESPGSWHGALISTGNASIVDQIDNEAISARVIEIEGPLSLDADHADWVRNTALIVHGHGLAAIAERGWEPKVFSTVADAMFAEIGTGTEKVARRIAWHLAMGAAGAHLLAELADVPELAADVTETARTVLAEQLRGLSERGARPGDRLLSLVADWMASNPGAFPTRQRYVSSMAGEFPLKDVCGWDLRDDDPAGDVAIIPTRLRDYAERAGITDLTIALKDLRKGGRLLTDAGKLMKRVRVGSDDPRAYTFTGLYGQPEPVPLPDPPPEASSPPRPPRRDGQNWSADPMPTTGPAAPAEGPLSPPAPCLTCGELSAWQRSGQPIHAGCDDPAPAVAVITNPPAESMIATPGPVPAAPAAPVLAAPVLAAPVLAVAADTGGLYVSGGELLDAAGALESLPAFLARVIELMPEGGSVAITADVATALGYPAAPKRAETFAEADRRKRASRKKVEPEPDPRAAIEGRAAGWLPADAGLQAWTTWRHPESGTRVHVLVIEWSGTDASSHVLITPDLSAAQACHRLTAWHRATGTPYVMTAGISGCNLLVAKRHHGRAPLRKWEPPTDCPAAGGAEHGYDHLRPESQWTEAERSASHVIGFDMRKAYLAGFAGADFAMDRLEHVGISGGFDKTRAGYWLISQPWKPFDLLPDLRGREISVSGKVAPVWVTTPRADLLLQTGMPEEMIVDAWLSPRATGHSARIGRAMAETLRDALKALSTPQSDDDAALAASLKAAYRETYGQIQRPTGSVYRQDWADTVIGHCWAAITRAVIRIGTQTGRWPVALDIDCAYYATSPAALPFDNPGFDTTDAPGKFAIKSIQTIEQFRAGRGAR
uniref:DUF927 domain-containing protein n=1 Tax=Planobispora rosea TaxID=35762 RepID=Q2MLT5_PLARO|nr:hypothetical protein pPR2.3c [Planobispora rosea]